MDKKTQLHILNVLRQGTVTWYVRNECLNRGRYKALVGKKNLWARDCDSCGIQTLQKDNALEVDHMIEIGSFEGSFDAYIAKMYCDLSNLQALCTDCHNKKTHFGNASMKYERKKIA